VAGDWKPRAIAKNSICRTPFSVLTVEGTRVAPARLRAIRIKSRNAMASYVEQETAESHDLATRERMLLMVLVATTLVVAYLIYRLLQPFLPALAWAFALAIIARPVHRWMSGKIQQRAVATGITVGLVAVLILGPALFVARQVTLEAIKGLQWVQEEDKLAEWQKTLTEQAHLNGMLAWADENVDLAAEAKQLLVNVTQNMTGWLAGTVWLGVQLLIMLLTLFFFLRDNEQVLRAVRSMVPLSNREANIIFHTVSDTIHATIFGAVAVAMVQGFMGGLIFFFLGIPGALVWGAIMGLLSIVPYLGAFVIWGPVATFLALQGDWTRAIVLTVYGMAAIGLIDNLLYPILVGRRMRLHTLVAFFAILGGVTAFGMSGIVLGPVIVAVALALIDVWRHRTAAGQGAENLT
jgi:predicted PurR-regulated permease PerM